MYTTCMLRSIYFPCDTGQLLKILEDEDITSDLSASNHQILQKMYSQASHVANQSMQHVERDDPKYFEQLKPLIDRPAILQKEYRRVDISLEWPPGTASYGGEILFLSSVTSTINNISTQEIRWLKYRLSLILIHNIQSVKLL